MPYEHDVHRTKSVVIAGAGPTGLTLAIELARRGMPVRIVDVSPSPFQGSRGKGIQPRTLEIFDQLGVIDHILESGDLYPSIRVHQGSASFVRGSLGTRHEATIDTPYPNLWMVPQFRTEAILRERLKGLGVEVELGVGFRSFEPSAGGVRVTLTNGEVVEAAYLVGCDGGRSAVRKALDLALVGEGLGDEAAIVGDVKVEGLDRTEWQVWPTESGPLTLCPLPKTDLFQLTAPESSQEEGLAKVIERVTGHRVTAVTWQSVYRPQVRMVEKYRVGRVFVAGDAAHVHPPTGGQGLNTGVQDAWNLGWKLAWAMHGGPDSILDTYEEERLPIAAAVLDLSKHLLVKRSIERGALTNQLGLHYRESSLSGDALEDEPLRPGDRMPDARTADGGRLFEAMRSPNATLVVRPSGVRILVRPDGYVAAVGRSDVATYAAEPVKHVELAV